MLRGPRDVGNGLDRHAIVVSLKGRTQNRQLLMRLQSSEALVGLDHAGRDPSQGHAGIAPAFDVARDAANGAHHVLGDVGTGERSTKLLRQLQPDDSQDFVEAFEDAGRYAGPLPVEPTVNGMPASTSFSVWAGAAEPRRDMAITLGAATAPTRM